LTWASIDCCVDAESDPVTGAWVVGGACVVAGARVVVVAGGRVVVGAFVVVGALVVVGACVAGGAVVAGAAVVVGALVVVVVRRTVVVVRSVHQLGARTKAAGLACDASALDIAHWPPLSASTATVPNPIARRRALLAMVRASAGRPPAL
jgi:hypothetical protein